MVDKLDGKEFKLGEYEHDEETGILYVGTHGTVFPGGSGTTGGGGGGSGGGGEGGWFPSGFEANAEIKYEFKYQPTIKTATDLTLEITNLKAFYGFFPISVFELKEAEVSFEPVISVNHGLFYE